MSKPIVLNCVESLTFNEFDTFTKSQDGTVVTKGTFSHRPVLVKSYPADLKEIALWEANILKRIDRHENIISFFCTHKEGQSFIHNVVENCVATMYEFVQEYDNKFTELDYKPLQLFKNVLSGLEYLHSVQIIHKHLHPKTVWIVPRNFPNEILAVIAEFSYCSAGQRFGEAPPQHKTFSGDIRWIAPDVKATKSTDVWGLGCILYFLLTHGHHPYRGFLGNHTYSTQLNLKQLGRNIEQDLIGPMVNLDPTNRPPVDAIASHPIFWNNTKILFFYCRTSQYLSVLDKPPHSLEVNAKSAIGATNWLNVVSPDLRRYYCKPDEESLIGSRPHSYGTSVLRLVNFLQYLNNHMAELSAKTIGDEVFGSTDTLINYYQNKFPNLLVHVWRAVEIYHEKKTMSEFYLSQNKNP